MTSTFDARSYILKQMEYAEEQLSIADDITANSFGVIVSMP